MEMYCKLQDRNDILLKNLVGNDVVHEISHESHQMMFL